MVIHKFHRDEKLVKEALTGNAITPDIIIEAMRGCYLIANDFNTLDIQRDLFSFYGLDKKYDWLDNAWEVYNRKYATGEVAFKNVDEFIDCLNYCGLDLQKSTKSAFESNYAVSVKNGKHKESDILTIKQKKLKEKLNSFETGQEEGFFEEFCEVLGIDYKGMNKEQLGLIKKFYKNTYEYGMKLVIKEQINFIEMFLPLFKKLEEKLSDRLFVSVEELKTIIQQYNPTINIRKVYDELTDNSYYIADLSNSKVEKSDKTLMKELTTGIGPLMFLGGVSDNINLVNGKTSHVTDEPKYVIDINLMSDEYKSFYAAYFNFLLRDVILTDYKYFVNDMLEWGPIYVGVEDLNKFVNNNLMGIIEKDKVATKMGLLLKDTKKLEKFLKKSAFSYKKMIDSVYNNTIKKNASYSDMVKKNKPEENIPFAEF